MFWNVFSLQVSITYSTSAENTLWLKISLAVESMSCKHQAVDMRLFYQMLHTFLQTERLKNSEDYWIADIVFNSVHFLRRPSSSTEASLQRFQSNPGHLKKNNSGYFKKNNPSHLKKNDPGYLKKNNPGHLKMFFFIWKFQLKQRTKGWVFWCFVLNYEEWSHKTRTISYKSNIADKHSYYSRALIRESLVFEKYS